MENTKRFTIDPSKPFAFIERKQKRLLVLAKHGKTLSKRQFKLLIIGFKNMKIE